MSAKIWDQAIRRPTAVWVATLGLCALGGLALASLPRELWPRVSLPFCVVTTIFPGASAAEVEKEVTDVVEARLAALTGLTRLASQSRANVSIALAQFDPDASPEAARRALGEALAGVSEALPASARAPTVSAFDVAALPVMVVAAVPSAAATADDFAAAAERLRRALAAATGVAEVRPVVAGGPPELHITLDAGTLAGLRLPAAMVAGRLRADHLAMPLGALGGRAGGARLAAHFASPAALGEMVLAPRPGGGVLRLAEVAALREVAPPAAQMTLWDGDEAIVWEVVREAGADILAVTAAGRAALATAAAAEAAHLAAHVVADQGEAIAPSLVELGWSLAFGGLMAVAVVWLFLADGRGTLITALALPTSVLGCLAVMWAAGFSLNQITLLSLSLAIGLLIDDAVVVRESIARRQAEGLTAARAASLGTGEVALAVTATTLTLCAVFVPLALMRGLAAQFFRQFGLTMAAAVLISLVVAFTLDPMLSAARPRPHAPGAWGRAVGRALDALERAYVATLAWALRRRWWVGLATVALCALAAQAARGLRAEFIASGDRDLVTVALELPAGTSAAAARAATAPLLARVRALPGVAHVVAHVGARGAPEQVDWRLLLAPAAARAGREEGSLEAIKARVRALVAELPGATTSVAEPPLLEGVGAWPAMEVRFLGDDSNALAAAAAAAGERLAALAGVADLRPPAAGELGEVVVTPDRQALAGHGLTAYELGAQLRLFGAGEEVGHVAAGQGSMAVRLLLGPAAPSLEAMRGLPIAVPLGAPAAAAGRAPPPTLGALARLDARSAPAVIHHEAQARSASLTFELAEGADLGRTCRAAKRSLAELDLPAGVTMQTAGQEHDMQEMLASTKLALALALLCVYIILAAQFESFVHPLTIMLSCPLALVGAVAALRLGDHSLSMGSCIGMILLLGLVTKNAILLVGCAQDIRAARPGTGADAAMLEAGGRRLRPILMTSSAMVLGMLPAALLPGHGAEFRGPMAQVVMGGVIASTALTLWAVPALFSLLGGGGTAAARGPGDR